jgi:hypothetical protein
MSTDMTQIISHPGAPTCLGTVLLVPILGVYGVLPVQTGCGSRLNASEARADHVLTSGAQSGTDTEFSAADNHTTSATC